jgi:hypothetical protein
MNCNCKSLLVAILVAFAAIWVTDFLIHAIWLAPIYGATKDLWRPEAEMNQKLPFMFLGQAIAAVAFTTIFALFVADKRSLRASMVYGCCVAFMAAGTNIIMYVVHAYPGYLVVRWILAGFAQMILLATVVHFAYRLPRAS